MYEGRTVQGPHILAQNCNMIGWNWETDRCITFERFGEIHKQIEDRQQQQQAGLLQQAFRSELISVSYVRSFARNGTLWTASKFSCAEASTLDIYKSEIIKHMGKWKKDLEVSQHGRRFWTIYSGDLERKLAYR